MVLSRIIFIYVFIYLFTCFVCLYVELRTRMQPLKLSFICTGGGGGG
jgi:hypothetical protein